LRRDFFRYDYLQADLDEGEAAAIAQADYKQAHLLIDEKKGFRRATVMQLATVRTVQLLNLMKEVGAIKEVKPYYDKLEKTGFYIKETVRRKISRRSRRRISRSISTASTHQPYSAVGA